EQLLGRHGAKVLFVARFLVGLRGPIYITAGILKMPFRKFLLADMVCATVVVTLFFGISLVFGEQIVRLIHEGEGVLTLVVITCLVIAAGVLFWFHLRNKKVPGIEILEEAQKAVEADCKANDDVAGPIETPSRSPSRERSRGPAV